MKRLAALIAALLLLAGCGSSAPLTQPEAAGGGAPVVQPEPAPKAPVVEPGPAPQAPVVQPEPAPQAPAVQPEPAQPTRDELRSRMARVSTPTPDELPARYHEVLMQRSPWAIAEQAAHWLHGGKLQEEPFLAPALKDGLAPVAQGTPDRVWTSLVSSWEEGGRFYFHLQVTGRTADGLLYRSGVDVVEISTVDGVGPVVTGYAHAPWAPEAEGSPVRIWVGRHPDSYIAPQEIRLSDAARAVLQEGRQTGEYLVPVSVLERVGPVHPAGSSAVVLDLGFGILSGPIKSVTLDGVSYVSIADLVGAVDGQHAGSSQGSYTYDVKWRADLGQLCLWRDEQHPIS